MYISLKSNHWTKCTNYTFDLCCLKVASKDTVCENQQVKDFFLTLVTSHLNFDIDCPHIDFLACNAVLHPDGLAIIKELENLTKVRMSHHTTGYFVNFEIAGYSLRYFLIPIFIKLLSCYCYMNFWINWIVYRSRLPCLGI